jgi:hypothetical protein
MNERIKELAEQAGWTEGYYESDNGPFIEPEFNKEKFAELIVRECLQMADEFEIDVNRSGLVDRMKYHFGLDNK